MNKKFVVIAFIALIVGAQCGQFSVSQKNKLCSPCVELMNESLSDLLNIILNGGVIGGCGKLCGLIPASKTVQEICSVVCDLVGVDVFINLIKKADLDSIWMCEKVTVCSHAMGTGKILTINVSPESGPAGTKFEVEVVFQVETEIGTGELDIEIVGGANMPVGDGELLVDTEPGEYGIKFSFTATPSEDDPWDPATYEVGMALCDGECGSKHEWSKVLGEKKGTFKITE
ncbi:hypothetical protein M0812_23913 [Anaeramoeba flamelloides]|uniref:Saposin B-type domain-containing protein n=1 Tax=Anaeramoeba flamelloides TaxID=1746091 RepID=A0AAV7YI78_9EUKA|nr:hypothetical protein M0812_23913 [Anaeramoeba flamelloides]|eukprot:Anaeramoba_flamelloidesa807790_9952.p1 GENE.a807790_9952~~a807790_9952.p1  ORF type:complete len:241 (+),score=38.88 a807790_9952:35-724(+)